MKPRNLRVLSRACEELEPRRLLSDSRFIFDPPTGTPNPHQLQFDLDLPADEFPNGAALSLSNLNNTDYPAFAQRSRLAPGKAAMPHRRSSPFPTTATAPSPG